MTSPLTIAWNGIHLDCPKQWETIVSGPKHLLFEDNFQPIFELRWQDGETSGKSSVAAILRKLQKETGLQRQESPAPVLRQLQKEYAVIALSTEENNGAKGVLLTCRHCGTTLLLYFLHAHALLHPALPQVLSSLSCHTQESPFILWAIQDVRILLPASYRLNSHNFTAGLTKLSFMHAGLTMHLCRLAQASHRLKTASLAELMLLLSGASVAEEDIIHGPHSAHHRNHPTILRQILTRLKRKPSFLWMTLRHHPEQDRLSGLFFEDNKPFSEEQTNTILESYEILSH